MNRLGERAGAALYERRGRALALTAAGEKLAAHARDAVAAEQALLASLRGEDDDTVVLATGEGALTHVVGAQVAAFARAHPRRLRVQIADGPAALDAVARGRAHVAIVAGVAGAAAPEGVTDAVVVRTLARARVVAVGAPALLADGGALALPELAAMELVLPPRGRPLRESVEGALAAHGLTPRVAVEASGWGAALLLARLACGVALVNDVVTVPRGLVVRAVDGLAPVTYRAVARRRRTALASELWRALGA